MKQGRTLSCSGLWCVLFAAGLIAGLDAPAAGQPATSPGACAQDSLVLVSPDSNSVQVALQGPPTRRFGVQVSWAPVPPADGTCAVLTKITTPADLVSVSGTYLDNIDREFRFTVLNTGDVGSATQNRLMVNWVNGFINRSGRVEGVINLSNNGGLLRLTRPGGLDTWTQVNSGLPSTLQTTDILALAQSPSDPGRMLVHLGSRGLWALESLGGTWTRLAPGVLTNAVTITALAYSPDDVQRFAVGTGGDGIFVTEDGGQTFTQFASSLDPVLLPNYQVTAMRWDTDGPLYAAVRNLGVFVSTNQGRSFVKLPHLTVPSVPLDPNSPPVTPVVNQIRIDPTNHGVVYFALKDVALYATSSAPADTSARWAPLTGTWLTTLGQSVTGLSVARDPNNPQVIVVGTDSHGLWRTADAGATWTQASYVDELPVPPPRMRGVVFDPQQSGVLLAAADGFKLLRSQDDGVSWSWAPTQPSNVSLTGLHVDTGGDAIWALTYGGGTYVPGTPIALSQTIWSGSDPRFLNKDFGLSLTFQSGSLVVNTGFTLKCQDFQGYAVWRSAGLDPVGRLKLELIGVYDKTNPQSCIEGYCGDPNYVVKPDCFQERRAACFDMTQPGVIKFFDDNVYNGFVYNYTVTTFDYGNTAGTEPTATFTDQLFSPRYPGDPNSPFHRAMRLVPFRVDLGETAPADGPEIFCYPNPLREGAGFPGVEGQQITFTNLPPGSRIRIFTEDGDLVADLPTATNLQAGGNMYWNTRNPSGSLLASGIYFWKVEMPQRGAFFGKLVIIR